MSKLTWNDLDVNKAVQTGLEALGLDLQAQSILLLQRNGMNDSGKLAASITFEVNGTTLTIGSNTMYAAYVEFGTGIYAESGNGRDTPWVYYDQGKRMFFWTKGMRPAPFLRPPIANTKRIIEVFQYGVDRSIRQQLGN